MCIRNTNHWLLDVVQINIEKLNYKKLSKCNKNFFTKQWMYLAQGSFHKYLKKIIAQVSVGLLLWDYIIVQ